MTYRSKQLAALTVATALAIGAAVTVSLAAPAAKRPIQGVVAQARTLRGPTSGLMKAPNPKLLDKARSLTAELGTKHAMMSAPSARLIGTVKGGAKKPTLMKGPEIKALRSANQLSDTVSGKADRARLVKLGRGKNSARPKR
ncbi:MAG: hypothetical protein U0V87_13215 [Acidobacteriota bacterium]